MALITGVVNYPHFTLANAEGKGAKFECSLGHTKGFRTEDQSMIFTKCVTYLPGLVKVLSEVIGQPEHAGKAITFFGHWDEYEWTPDPNTNPEHEKFCVSITITAEQLMQLGFAPSQTAPPALTVMQPVKQKSRQFVIKDFEFVPGTGGGARPASTAGQPVIRVAGMAGGAGQIPAVGQVPTVNQIPGQVPAVGQVPAQVPGVVPGVTQTAPAQTIAQIPNGVAPITQIQGQPVTGTVVVGNAQPNVADIPPF